MLGFNLDVKSQQNISVYLDDADKISELEKTLLFEAEISLWDMTAQEADELAVLLREFAERSKNKRKP